MSKKKDKKARNAVIGQKPRGLLGTNSGLAVMLILTIINVFFPDEAVAIGDRIKGALVDHWTTVLQAVILIWLLWLVYRMWSRLEDLSNLVWSQQEHLTALISGNETEES